MKTLLLALVAGLGPGLTACASSASHPGTHDGAVDAARPTASDAAENAARELVLVHLRTGPRSGTLPAAENQAAFAGHFANMQRLANERLLLVAGPYGKERHDAALRGLFVLDVADVADAELLASTDPAVQAGVFVVDAHRIATDAPLHAFLEAELQREDEARRAGRQIPLGEGMRTYVLLSAEDGDAAARALEPLAARGDVLLHARLDDAGAFVLLDAQSLADARALLADAAGDPGPYVLDSWFASDGLADLPHLAASTR